MIIRGDVFMKKVLKIITLLIAVALFCSGSYYAYSAYETNQKIAAAQKDVGESLYNYSQYKNGKLQKQFSDAPFLGKSLDDYGASIYADDYSRNTAKVQNLTQKKSDNIKFAFLTYTSSVIFFAIFGVINKKAKMV